MDEPEFHWDAPRDTRYAHEISGLEGLLHVFQQGWFGVRAAAGSLPGRKVALKSPEMLSRHAIKRLGRTIIDSAPKRVVIHGMSDSMSQLIEELASQGLQERLFVVLHGAPSQWFSEPEARYAFKCLDLARQGTIQRLHIMKSGFEFPEQRLYRPMLFNLPPRLHPVGLSTPAYAGYEPMDADECVRALVPGWSGWRKNVHANAFGAAISARIDEVLAFSNDLKLPPPLDGKLKVIGFRSREQTFQLIQGSAVVMNVSLVDCHPMIHLEAQALGKACLRGPLFLDALEEHAYVRLTQVNDPSSPAEIRDALERVLDVPSTERADIIHDYQSANNRIAVQRYHEFLEI